MKLTIHITMFTEDLEHARSLFEDIYKRVKDIHGLHFNGHIDENLRHPYKADLSEPLTPMMPWKER